MFLPQAKLRWKDLKRSMESYFRLRTASFYWSRMAAVRCQMLSSFPESRAAVLLITSFPLGEQYRYNLDHMCRSLDWPEAYKLGILRIGIDTGGSGLYLVSRGINTGSILFVDREEVLRKSEPVILADSFDGFLSMLTDE